MTVKTWIGAILVPVSGVMAHSAESPGKNMPIELITVLEHAEAIAGPHDIQLQRNYAFIPGKGARGNVKHPGSFAVVNIANPRAPEITGYLSGFTNAETVLPAGDICFLGGTHFHAIDISEPSNPQIAATLTDTRINSINGMVRRGDRLIAASKGNHFTVFDISDPRNPTLVGAVKPWGRNFNSPHDIALLDEAHIVTVNIQAQSGRDRLQVYRIAKDADSPLLSTKEWELVGSINEDRLKGANRVRVKGEYAIVACNKGFAVGVVDLRNKQNPVMVAHFPLQFKSSGMALAGETVIYALTSGKGRIKSGLAVYDISSPSAMSLLAQVHFENVSPDHDLVYRDGYIYATDQDENTFCIFEVVNPDLRRRMEQH